MKKTTLTILLLSFITIGAFAQNSGQLTYTRKINVHKMLPPEQAAFKAMIPEFKNDKITITFNEKSAKLEVEPLDKGESSVMMGDFEEPLFIDRVNVTTMNTLSLDGEIYGTIVPAEKTDFSSKETKKINGYTCSKYTIEVSMESQVSTNQDDTEGGKTAANVMTIWYTKELPAGMTPQGASYCPGTVVLIESEAMSYTLNNFEKRAVSDKEAKPSADVIEVTEEQMSDLMEEKMDAMMPNH